MDILDIWVNLVTPESAASFLGQDENAHIPGYLGGDGSAGVGVDQLLGVMDALGVATGVLTPGDRRRCAQVARGRGRASRAASSSPASCTTRALRPRTCGASVRTREDPRFSLVRVSPLATQVAIDDPKHYPVYQVCEELQIPVAINVGIPGPRVRSRVQHPDLLEDVLIDFPDLVVIGAHMGHPYEELLMNYMRKWPNLYLSCTAYAPKYMDANLLAFMNTSTYRGRVLWGSDEPWFPMQRSLTEARALPLDEDALAQFLGGTARRLLDRTTRLDPGFGDNRRP